MLRVSSETAVAMRLWSTMPKPSRRATSRARCRAKTMSSSRPIGMRSSAGLAAAMPAYSAVNFGCHQASQERHALLGVQRGGHTTQLQAQFHQRDRDRRLDTDDYRLGSQQARRGADVVEQPAQERVHRLDNGEVAEHPARAGAL